MIEQERCVHGIAGRCGLCRIDQRERIGEQITLADGRTLNVRRAATTERILATTDDDTCGGLDRVAMCVEGDAPAEHYCVRCELDLCDDHFHGTGHEDHNDEDDATEEKRS